MHLHGSETAHASIVNLPEWEPGIHTQCATSEEAAQRGQELLGRLVRSLPQIGSLPAHHRCDATALDPLHAA
jgi:predicted RNase H-like HicB family nuclease